MDDTLADDNLSKKNNMCYQTLDDYLDDESMCQR